MYSPDPLLFVCCICTSIPAAAMESTPLLAERAETPRQLYRAGCAACHGNDGTGAPQALVAFDTPLPDFSDCSFATREPNTDWFAVTHDGGPARGFAAMMPALGEAMTDVQLQKALAHVRTFCRSDDWPPGELNLPRPLFAEKAYPEDEAVFTTGADVEGGANIENELVYEKRFGARNQLEVSVPFSFLDEGSDAGGWTGGVGDVALGVKSAFAFSTSTGSILSLAAEVLLPTGNAERGFGAGTFKFEPFLSYGQIIPVLGFLHVQAGLELPLDTDDAEQEGFWRAAYGRSFSQGRFGRNWTPMVEMLGARALESGAEIEWDIAPQMQVTLNKRQHIMANVGTRIPLTQRGERDVQVLAYLLWDWFDGGLLEGW